ncbi:CbiX/SirB N-terminal domain-containing protein [Paenibacillus sp. FSL H8-0317]|uniref:CbiX/SirB N-terminal domain-containing protein n=1 Tax=Paenibacillus amylolyticus TaxID=1451 RepID=A0ABD8AUV4_PAEAM|nr:MULTISPECIES: CbiX/SirB N-terminal domain-containing protein [Paenibacillus]ETT55547.1 cobalamin (Vitamin B12) biosynthesis CbiX protein [Paenibacillus sp. FSL H7-689]KLU58117.1 cobalamin biosynthesis protein CbiX [Paenibacillus sp. VT-400]OMF01012.1 cobalamin biosynthesis protein CbiX [Paenibacillus amylolyticus]OMF40283.1 cobalamin biosynthesis protein CbiX [Paenibacillus amylolyticus]WFA83422.1 cobalamin biosynthesis protein CbiX [Paenibacillus amylolyticus]
MKKPGVLIISHGSQEQTWVESVDDAISRLNLPVPLPVEAGFLELVEGRLIQDGIDRLEAQGVTDILVVPLFVSSGSTHVDEIEYAIGAKETPDRETDLEPFDVKARVHFGYPVDNDPDIAVMVWDKVRVLSQQPEEETILLVGHGSIHDGFRERWEAGISSLAERVQEVSDVAHTDYALLNPESVYDKVKYWSEERGNRVIVAPLFLSAGYFTRNVIPGRLQELNYVYSGETLLPHPLLGQWLERQIQILLERCNEVKASS